MPNKVHLEIIGPSSRLRRITVESSITIGRAKGCKIRIPSRAISRQHCRIELSNGHASIKDLGSSNGTYVNGKRLAANIISKLPDASHLRIGDQKFKVVVEEIAVDLEKTSFDQDLFKGGVAAAGVAGIAAAAGLGDTMLETELPSAGDLATEPEIDLLDVDLAGEAESLVTDTGDIASTKDALMESASDVFPVSEDIDETINDATSVAVEDAVEEVDDTIAATVEVEEDAEVAVEETADDSQGSLFDFEDESDDDVSADAISEATLEVAEETADTTDESEEPEPDVEEKSGLAAGLGVAAAIGGVAAALTGDKTEAADAVMEPVAELGAAATDAAANFGAGLKDAAAEVVETVTTGADEVAEISEAPVTEDEAVAISEDADAEIAFLDDEEDVIEVAETTDDVSDDDDAFGFLQDDEEDHVAVAEVADEPVVEVADTVDAEDESVAEITDESVVEVADEEDQEAFGFLQDDDDAEVAIAEIAEETTEDATELAEADEIAVEGQSIAEAVEEADNEDNDEAFGFLQDDDGPETGIAEIADEEEVAVVATEEVDVEAAVAEADGGEEAVAVSDDDDDFGFLQEDDSEEEISVAELLDDDDAPEEAEIVEHIDQEAAEIDTDEEVVALIDDDDDAEALEFLQDDDGDDAVAVAEIADEPEAVEAIDDEIMIADAAEDEVVAVADEEDDEAFSFLQDDDGDEEVAIAEITDEDLAAIEDENIELVGEDEVLNDDSAGILDKALAAGGIAAVAGAAASVLNENVLNDSVLEFTDDDLPVAEYVGEDSQLPVAAVINEGDEGGLIPDAVAVDATEDAATDESWFDEDGDDDAVALVDLEEADEDTDGTEALIDTDDAEAEAASNPMAATMMTQEMPTFDPESADTGFSLTDEGTEVAELDVDELDGEADPIADFDEVVEDTVRGLADDELADDVEAVDAIAEEAPKKKGGWFGWLPFFGGKKKQKAEDPAIVDDEDDVEAFSDDDLDEVEVADDESVAIAQDTEAAEAFDEEVVDLEDDIIEEAAEPGVDLEFDADEAVASVETGESEDAAMDFLSIDGDPEDAAADFLSGVGGEDAKPAVDFEDFFAEVDDE